MAKKSFSTTIYLILWCAVTVPIWFFCIKFFDALSAKMTEEWSPSFGFLIMGIGPICATNMVTYIFQGFLLFQFSKYTIQWLGMNLLAIGISVVLHNDFVGVVYLILQVAHIVILEKAYGRTHWWIIFNVAMLPGFMLFRMFAFTLGVGSFVFIEQAYVYMAFLFAGMTGWATLMFEKKRFMSGL